MAAPVEVHPLVRDGRRRSLLTPFLAVEAVKHWDALTSQASPIKTKRSMKVEGEAEGRKGATLQPPAHKTATASFLTEVATVLSDAGATDVDCITALVSLLQGLISKTKSRRITGKEIFGRRLVPVLSAVHTSVSLVVVASPGRASLALLLLSSRSDGSQCTKHTEPKLDGIRPRGTSKRSE